MQASGFSYGFIRAEDCLCTTWLLKQPIKVLNFAMHHKPTCLFSWYLNIKVECNTLTLLVSVSTLKQEFTYTATSAFWLPVWVYLKLLSLNSSKKQTDLAEIRSCRRREKEVITLQQKH